MHSLIANLRWDCASEEEEYLIHLAHDQHIQRISDFLISELKIVDDVDEANKLIFFVSAKEAMTNHNERDSPCNSPLKNKRCLEWDR